MAGAVVQLLPEEAERPVRARVAELLRGMVQEVGQQPPRLFRPEAGASHPRRIGQGDGVMVAEIALDPVVDALPGHAQSRGDPGYRCPPIDLEDRQGPSVDASIPCRSHLASEPPALPRG